MRLRQGIISTKPGLLFLVVLLSACTNLSAVREWSETSQQAVQFNEIVATYSDTPRRVAFYDKEQAEFWNQQLEDRQAQQKALELQLSLIADYMAALSALSADSVSDFTDEVPQLTGSLKKTGKVSEDTIGSFGKLATTLLNAATNQWQKRQVAKLIEEANPHLQVLLGNELRSIVDRDFRRDLEIEKGFLDRHFEDLLRFGKGSDVANAALEEWFVLRVSENERRMQAVDAYLVVLDRISKGHQELYEGRKDLGSVQLVKELFKLAKEIRNNVKEIVKA